MTIRKLLLVLVVLSLALSAQAEDNPYIGTWKQNNEKSTVGPGQKLPKSNTHVWEPWGNGGVKCTATVIQADGKASNTEYAVNFDGKFYPIKGDPNRDMLSVVRVDQYTFQHTSKKGDKVTGGSRHVFSKDFKTLSVHMRNGGVRVYDKQ